MKSVRIFRLSFFLAAISLSLARVAASDFSIKQALISKPLPEDLKIFQKAYPDLIFFVSYDPNIDDWNITVRFPPDPDRGGHYESAEFYWAEGKLLPKEELENKKNYTEILYKYPELSCAPEKLTKAERQKIKTEYSAANRKTAPGTSMFFFDAMYSATNKVDMESHLVRTTFLGHPTRIHERIYYQFKEAEKKIKSAAAKDKELQAFVKSIKSSAAFNWRVIAGTNRLSLHSYGIAIDVLPKKLKGKSIFWQYETGRNPNDWMAIPNSKRWMPPKKFIDIFEKEGFIWGGNWVNFDNMHFEYRPELLYFNGIEVEK